MPVAVVHGKRIKARVLGLNEEDERARPFRFLARRDGIRSNGTPRPDRPEVCPGFGLDSSFRPLLSG